MWLTSTILIPVEQPHFSIPLLAACKVFYPTAPNFSWPPDLQASQPSPSSPGSSIPHYWASPSWLPSSSSAISPTQTFYRLFHRVNTGRQRTFYGLTTGTLRSNHVSYPPLYILCIYPVILQTQYSKIHFSDLFIPFKFAHARKKHYLCALFSTIIREIENKIIK